MTVLRHAHQIPTTPYWLQGHRFLSYTPFEISTPNDSPRKIERTAKVSSYAILDQISVRFALQQAVFELRAIWKQMHTMTTN